MIPIRPKNLNLFTIHFPIPAVVSILHRISGAVLVLLIPVALWALDLSLNEAGFMTIKQWLVSPSIKMIFLLLILSFCFHLVAGLRHLLSDIHLGDTLPAGAITGLFTFVLSLLLTILIGFWIW